MRNARGLIGGVFVGFFLGMLLLFGITRLDLISKVSDVFNGDSSPEMLKIGAPAPDFGLVNLNGDSVHLEDYRGQIVLVNFWATWCGPCRLEMPAFQSRVERRSEGWAVLAINSDDSLSDARDFVDELGLTFDVLLDPDRAVQRQYQVRGLPTSYFIDQDGILQLQHIGILTESQLDEYLQELGL